MRFTVYDDKNKIITARVYYSIGGGFILDEDQAAHPHEATTADFPYPFSSAKAY